MEIKLTLQYKIATETKWCRTEVAERLGAAISDAPYIFPPQVQFVVKRECQSPDVLFDEIAEEIAKLIPEAKLQTAFRTRDGGRLPVIMYDSTGRVRIHGYG